ncbi:ATP-binding cassette domain-containing protein [Plantactinospora sp. GCM10030261]|uniref:ATP-binding cassette domain-containing protein n=1 Tax=Plantactinospora sp. GCM10030261 TaxID=3273420 RepID=UPI0036156275
MTTRPSAIAVTGLRKSFGAHVVLDGIDFTVPTGTVFALLGPNGAGKTTTVQILSTLIRADGGEARVADHDVAREPDAVRAAIGVTGQFAAVDGLLASSSAPSRMVASASQAWSACSRVSGSTASVNRSSRASASARSRTSAWWMALRSARSLASGSSCRPASSVRPAQSARPASASASASGWSPARACRAACAACRRTAAASTWSFRRVSR